MSRGYAAAAGTLDRAVYDCARCLGGCSGDVQCEPCGAPLCRRCGGGCGLCRGCSEAAALEAHAVGEGLVVLGWRALGRAGHARRIGAVGRARRLERAAGRIRARARWWYGEALRRDPL